MSGGISVGEIGEEVHLRIVQHTVFGPQRITITNPDGSPANLTGCTARAHIRRKASDPAIVVAFDVVIVNALTGAIDISLDETGTALVPAVEDSTAPGSRSVWDFVLDDAVGRTHRLLRGPVTGYLLVSR